MFGVNPTLTLIVLALGFWIWMLVDCVQNEPSEGNDKIAWLLIILLLNWPGALIYYVLRRSTRIRTLGH